jgi:hypothetical protein
MMRYVSKVCTAGSCQCSRRPRQRFCETRQHPSTSEREAKGLSSPENPPTSSLPCFHRSPFSTRLCSCAVVTRSSPARHRFPPSRVKTGPSTSTHLHERTYISLSTTSINWHESTERGHGNGPRKGLVVSKKETSLRDEQHRQET